MPSPSTRKSKPSSPPNILTANVEITGVRALLMNRFGPDAIPLTKRERSGVAGNDPTEWKRRVCWNKKGQLYLESATVFGCVRDGAKFTKRGHRTNQVLVVATLQVSPAELFL